MLLNYLFVRTVFKIPDLTTSQQRRSFVELGMPTCIICFKHSMIREERDDELDENNRVLDIKDDKTEEIVNDGSTLKFQ